MMKSTFHSYIHSNIMLIINRGSYFHVPPSQTSGPTSGMHLTASEALSKVIVTHSRLTGHRCIE
jgi:hypothetical protein